MSQAPVKKWSPELEGLRGIASLWVVFGHICLLIQFKFPILSDPGMGVDLFILLSGFLMAKNYMERRILEPWNDKNTFFKFWIRRFFRIAPLYYFLLIIALVFGPFFGEFRDIISSYYPTTSTEASRYSDHSIMNIITHLFLIFGFLPHYSYETVLPDWSIGLEIQYYILFPFIMIMILRFGYLKIAFFLMGSCALIRLVLPSYFFAFEMPSMIFSKLHLFVAGMLISEYIRDKNFFALLMAFLIPPFISLFLHVGVTKARAIAEMVMVLFITLILYEYKTKTLISKAASISSNFLTSKFSVFLGDVSYSVYLLHLLVVILVIPLLLRFINLATLPVFTRFIAVSFVCIPIIYGISIVLYNLIEKPGILLGKHIIKIFAKEK